MVKTELSFGDWRLDSDEYEEAKAWTCCNWVEGET